MGRRRTVLLLAFMGSAALLASGVLAGFGPTGASAQVRERPDTLPVATDDPDDGAGSIAHVGGRPPRPLVADRGATFGNAYATRAPCCPSGAPSPRGRYPHNAGADENNGAD